MKSVLPEWYRPGDDEIADFLRTGTVVLDTNVLLALYRVNGIQRDQILDVLTKVGDRLWIPYQVAYEYQKRRLEVASELQQVYDKIQSIPAEKVADILDAASKSLRQAYSEIAREIRDKEIKSSIARAVEDTVEKLADFANERQAEMSEVISGIREKNAIDFGEVKGNDPVRSALDRLLDVGNIGKRPDSAKLEERRRLAAARLEKKVPPGYKDSKKEDPFGDALIWLEILEHAERTKNKVIFVTDDVKDDFYIKVHGQIIGPRTEMIYEMLDTAGQPYHQTTLDGFLRLASLYLQVSVTEDTITTLESTRKRSESNSVDTGWASGLIEVSDGASQSKAVLEQLLAEAPSEKTDYRTRSLLSRRSYLEREYARKVAAYGEFSSDALFYKNLQASNLYHLGEYDRALETIREVIRAQEVHCRPDDFDVLTPRITYARTLYHFGDNQKADAQIELIRRLVHDHHLSRENLGIVRDVDMAVDQCISEKDPLVRQGSILTLARIVNQLNESIDE
ncbi:PIN domain-containing protein [Nocardia sp. Root136]|uniref:PIN domain-containing protein n=1 Tax=Nocardia sp. Root136 TaxID=1736458 RepID=UPI000B204640|nr:PIN domain-containing protein [Nocardia sp. Root136]